ncbi:hypothetical protein DPMN_133320 [Dreissena polymorpha]|uniref:Uncharacterized protein n=1 Tax=Dreissena polymorpha TaxID=45954 RepID=A0A9D4JEP2_DREPO|nr:hypothetical protein DPMN_133320 [Dreissena polymorpha]
MPSFFPTTSLQNAYEIGQLILQFRVIKRAVLMGDFYVNGFSTPAYSGYGTPELIFKNTCTRHPRK